MNLRKLAEKPVFADRTARRCMAPGGPEVVVMGERYQLPCIRPTEPEHEPNHLDHYAAVWVEGEEMWYAWQT